MEEAGLKATILTVARDQLAQKGYAGTSIADIAAAAHTSKAAVFYHFPSKKRILETLLAELLAELSSLVRRAERDKLTPAQVLTDYVDGIIRSHRMLVMIANDLSAQEIMVESGVTRLCERLIDLLAGPHPDTASRIRARIAFSIAQSAVNIIAAGYEPAAVRAHVVAAAVNVMDNKEKETP